MAINHTSEVSLLAIHQLKENKPSKVSIFSSGEKDLKWNGA
jgi:hypothetical protein